MNNIYCPNHYWIIRNKSQGREPTKGEQYIPDSGNRPGTAEKEAVGGRTSAKEREKIDHSFINGNTCPDSLC